MEIGLGRKLTKDIEEINSEILSNLEESALSEIDNPLHLILQAHLYIEFMLDRFIAAELPNGSLVINKGFLSFKQKTLLAGTFTIIETQVIDSILQLNKLRNNLAHKFNHVITDKETNLIGRPLGKDFTKMEKSANGCLIRKLQFIVSFIASCVATNAIMSENTTLSDIENT